MHDAVEVGCTVAQQPTDAGWSTGAGDALPRYLPTGPSVASKENIASLNSCFRFAVRHSASLTASRSSSGHANSSVGKWQSHTVMSCRLRGMNSKQMVLCMHPKALATCRSSRDVEGHKACYDVHNLHAVMCMHIRQEVDNYGEARTSFFGLSFPRYENAFIAG